MELNDFKFDSTRLAGYSAVPDTHYLLGEPSYLLNIICLNITENNRVLARKHEGKKPLGRPKCRWEDNIKMDLTEIV
jgi:hypothetical protein